MREALLSLVLWMNEGKQRTACLWSQALEQLSRAQLGASVPLCYQVQHLNSHLEQRPTHLDFGLLLWALDLVGVLGNSAKRLTGGLGQSERNAQARRRGRQSGSLAFKNVRISERFKSTDFRDKIPGRGSFLSFFRVPSNCFLMKMCDVCFSLYLPCWSIHALKRYGV